MNSILQVLRYTPGFLENLAQLFQDIVASEKIKKKNRNNEETEEASNSFEEENCKKCWKIVKNVHRVYRDLSLLEEKYEEVASDDVMSMAVKPSKVLHSVRELNPMFEGNLQHDAQEFMRCLLCYLQDASKEVQKFYCQLPPRLSPRAVVLNPIMQRFLKAAQKMGMSSSKDTSKTDEENKSTVVVKNVEEVTSETVKVNLFPKAEDVSIEEKPEAAKSPSKIQIAPNLGDTASVVDEKTTNDIQSGTVPKGDANGTNDVEMENATIKSNTGAEPSVSGQPSRNRGMARRGRRFNPYRKNSSSKSEKYEEMKLSVKPSSSKKSKKGASPVDKLQPSISDMFVTKTYSAKKRLGMSSTVVRKTSEELFDEIKANSKGSKPAVNASSPRKSQSMPILNDMSHNVDMQPIVSLTHLQGKISPERKSESPVAFNLQTESVDVNANAKVETTEDNENESSKDAKTDTNVDERSTGTTNDKSGETSKAETDNARSFQDMFSQFLHGSNCPIKIFDSDTDSVDLLTDSDNEDIVAQKKIAKRLHQSPRRSPRKLMEVYQSSPRNSVSLDAQSEAVRSSSPRKTLSFDSKNNLSLNKFKTMSSSNDSNKMNENNSGKLEETHVKSEEMSENICNKEESSENTEQKTDVIAMDGKCAEIGDRNLFPIVKLEKCDHVFDGGSKSVSANYAAKCLTPMKNSPRKSDPADSSNYLKCRNFLQELDIKDESDLQKAIEEMYNSPVKNRSKCDLIEGLFQGSMMLRTRCLQCESSRERREEFHDVSVPVRLERSDSDDEEDMETDSRCGLMKLIEASTEVEKLLEDNKYYCEECKCYVEAERSMLYDVMPDILTLHLKRFSATVGKFSSITKINDEVEIPFTLPCLRYRCPKVCLRPDHRYSLYAVVTHSGVTLTAGHYLAYVRALPKLAPQENLQNDIRAKQEAEEAKQEAYEDEKPEKQPDTENLQVQNSDKNRTKMPMTRKKMGITAKLPSRFEDSVTTTKVKTYKTMTKVKPVKTNLAECLLPSKRFSTEWFECDDETVRVFSEEDFKDMVDGRSGAMLGTPYLLFYHKATMV